MIATDLFGILAGTLLVVAYIPQIRRLYKVKRAEEISLGLFCMVAGAGCLYIGYGISINDPIIISVNIAILSVDLILIAMKLHYDRVSRNHKSI